VSKEDATITERRAVKFGVHANRSDFGFKRDLRERAKRICGKPIQAFRLIHNERRSCLERFGRLPPSSIPSTVQALGWLAMQGGEGRGCLMEY
jgi:hypothetical protein